MIFFTILVFSYPKPTTTQSNHKLLIVVDGWFLGGIGVY